MELLKIKKIMLAGMTLAILAGCNSKNSDAASLTDSTPAKSEDTDKKVSQNEDHQTGDQKVEASGAEAQLSYSEHFALTLNRNKESCFGDSHGQVMVPHGVNNISTGQCSQTWKYGFWITIFYDRDSPGACFVNTSNLKKNVQDPLNTGAKCTVSIDSGPEEECEKFVVKQGADNRIGMLHLPCKGYVISYQTPTQEYDSASRSMVVPSVRGTYVLKSLIP